MGGAIRTVEGLAVDGQLSALQAGVPRPRGAPVRLLHAGHAHGRDGAARGDPDPSREAVVEGIDGNLCRCTGYVPIVDAVLEARPDDCRQLRSRP